jgi:hypothetical protein
LKKVSGWIFVTVGVVGWIFDQLLFTGVKMQVIGFVVLLAPLIGLYLLVDAYLKIEDGDVLMSVTPPRFWL